MPILEKYSGKECGVDFSVGYSPERVNPGDKKIQSRILQKLSLAMMKKQRIS
ncbi:hypothetical protein ACT7DL_01690 [Bacillus paranthracis]